VRKRGREGKGKRRREKEIGIERDWKKKWLCLPRSELATEAKGTNNSCVLHDFVNVIRITASGAEHLKTIFDRRLGIYKLVRYIRAVGLFKMENINFLNIKVERIITR
jgi:hypothetical protein